MNGSPILEHFRQQLADEVVAKRHALPRVDPLNINPWLAMSLMQKAIRRGREGFAVRAAATLLRVSPERLWRRLCVTAYEDIGIADFGTVAIVTAALKGKTFRAEIGGEWIVASYLIHRMCHSDKCRTADDLPAVCERHPDYAQTRLDLTFKPVPELLRTATSEGDLPVRALALWFAIGTDRCRSDALRNRKGEPQAVFDGLCERGFPETVVEVCREGFKKCNEVLPPFSILIDREPRCEARRIECDRFPDEEMIGPVPGWAYDMHVREGNLAIARLLKSDARIARWAEKHIAPNRRAKAIGQLLFRAESGLLNKRLRWATGDRLHSMYDLCVVGLDPAAVPEGLRILREDLPRLNEARRHVASSNFR